MTQTDAVLGEIVIRYDNDRQYVGTMRALERIQAIAESVDDDCDDDGWMAIVTVRCPADADAVRRIVHAAPNDMEIIRDEIAESYVAVTPRQILAANVSVPGGVGDEEDYDSPASWRLAITRSGPRLEVLESRGLSEPQWHEAMPVSSDSDRLSIHRLLDTVRKP